MVIISFIVGALVGLLVGRRNPKSVNSTVIGAREILKSVKDQYNIKP